MGLKEWAEGKKKSEQKLYSSTDFRKEKKSTVEPRIPYLTDAIGIPYFGGVKTYYLLLLLFFILFIFTKNAIIGILGGLNILFIIIWEFYAGSKTGGMKNEIKDTVIAILIGLIVWFGSGWILDTPTPINAIVSCSMLPAYERGDMVILQGGHVNTKYMQYDGLINDIVSTATIKYGNITKKVQGSLYSYCAQNKDDICDEFKENPAQFSETHGPLELKYGVCTKFYPEENKKISIACVKETYFNGEKIEFDEKYELVVQQPKKTDLYSLTGDIVHRVRFAVNASDGIIYFTKGDNNAIYDFQLYSKQYKMGNSPVEEEQVKGRVILRIPLLGNFKLFIA
ncbi:MAG: hypothetical protein ABIH83_06005, partial [Candidatus Micrarchaeota archaeon]